MKGRKDVRERREELCEVGKERSVTSMIWGKKGRGELKHEKEGCKAGRGRYM